MMVCGIPIPSLPIVLVPLAATISGSVFSFAIGPVYQWTVSWQKGCPGCNGIIMALPAVLLAFAVVILGLPAKLWSESQR